MGAATCAALILLPLKGPIAGWGPLLWDWAHTPASALLAWEAARLLKLRKLGPWPLAIVVLVSTVVLAAILEWLQKFSGRQSDWADVGKSVAGAGIGICVSIRPSLRRGRFVRVTVPACLCLAWSLSDLGLRAVLIHEKRLAFPRLEDFGNSRSLVLWRLEHDLTVAPLVRSPLNDGWQLEVPVPPARHTALHYDAQGRDWRPYRRLRLRYTLDGVPALHLGVRMDATGGRHERAYSQTHLAAGTHDTEIALPVGDARELILARVGHLVLFSPGGGQLAQLKIQELRLE